MKYKNIVTGLLRIEDNFLSEEKCKTFYLYLKSIGLYRKDKTMYFSDGTYRVEFISHDGRYANLDINSVIKEACFYEYTADRKKNTSITNFSSGERLDIVRKNGSKRYVFTSSNYRASLIYDEADSEKIPFRFIHTEEIPEDIKPIASTIHEQEEAYERIISARIYAESFEEKKKENKKMK